MMKALLILLCVLCMSAISWSQIDLKGKLKDKINNRIDEKVDKSMDEGLDAVESSAEKNDSQNESTETKEESITEETPISTQEAKSTKINSFTKYDFIPGDKVILFEDFSQDALGDFPGQWTTNGSGEVRTIQGMPGNWLYMNSQDNVYCLMKDMELPSNFIFEFDVVPIPVEDGSHNQFTVILFNGDGEYMNDDIYPGQGGVRIDCSTDHWRIVGYNEGAGGTLDGYSKLAPLEINQLNHVIVWVQKRRLRIYHAGQKVVDLPTIIYDGVKFKRVIYSLWSGEGFPFVSNIRFTTAAPDTRSKLLTEGHFVSYGIYFDVNSDKIKPESNGAISDIAKVLNENPQVKIKIVGHTDSDGNDKDNLELSKRRALAVKNELSQSFGVSAERIQTDGKGESQPIGDNQKPEGKAQNRRVEFIKL